MPRVKKAREGSSGRGRRTRRDSEVTEPHVQEAAGRGARSRASVSNDDADQTSVAALTLDQLIDAVGVRVRQKRTRRSSQIMQFISTIKRRFLHVVKVMNFMT